MRLASAKSRQIVARDLEALEYTQRSKEARGRGFTRYIILVWALQLDTPAAIDQTSTSETLYFCLS